MFDLIIKNGKTLDLDNGLERETALGIKDGKIKEVNLQPGGFSETAKAKRVVDAGGSYMFPGFIDFHTHLFSKGSFFGMNADRLFSSGVTTAVDMGTAGAANYEAFHLTDVKNKKMEIKTFLNLSPIGQPGSGINEPLAPEVISEKRMEELIQEYAGEIKGIKVRLSKPIVGALGIEPLLHAVKLGERFSLPVCVHTTNPPVPAKEVVKVLRKGDIYSHTFHNKGFTILDEKGHVQKEFFEAQERGVILELGNGKMNFSFEVAKKALADGLFPDVISSDSTKTTYQTSNLMRDLSFVMSKMWNMGMPLHDVIRSVTVTPAELLGEPERIGALKEGYEADIAICRRAEENVIFEDSDGERLEGTKLLIPEMTIKGGEIVYSINQ